MSTFRNGIAQFLASQRIEVWLIQGLLRHSYNSQTVLGYIREAHILAATDLAEQAWLARDMGAIRAELNALHSRASALRGLTETGAKASPHRTLLFLLNSDEIEHNPDSHLCSPLPSSEAAAASHGLSSSTPGAASAPEGDDPVRDLIYIEPRPLHGKHGKALGKIHTVDPTDISRSLCGWRFTKFADNEGHIFSTTPHPSENVAIEGALRCSTCSRCEEQLSL